MSKPAYVRLVEQIPAIRKMQYADSTGKLRHIGETGAWLLMYLCSELNKDGTFFMTAQSMRELTGTSTVSEIRRLLAGFEQLGLITRTGEEISYLSRGMPTPVYAMTFVPGLWKPDLIGSPLSSPGATNKQDENPYDKRKTQVSYQIEPEPEPDSNPEPDSDSSHVEKRQRKEGIDEAEVLRLCIQFETAEMKAKGKEVMPGLIKKWESDYPMLIAIGIEGKHGETNEALAWWCKDTRATERTGSTPAGSYRATNKVTPVTHLPAPSQGMADCFVCKGVGHGLVRDAQGVATTRKCVCTGGAWNGETTLAPTTERVSAGVSSNTHIPTPPGSADPQSFTQLVKDMSQNFRAG